MENKNLPAYPDPQRGRDQSYSNQMPEGCPSGLTKLEMVSAMCLQGLLANPNLTTNLVMRNDTWPIEAAAAAMLAASALLTHLSNTEK